MIGQHVQNYTITSCLGEGGMGTVYRASDTMLGRDVALKMLHGTLISQPQFLDRFKKEARILAQLLHPNIAVIYNFIGQDNNHFMVMEYVEGSNLDTVLRKYKQIPYEIVVPIFLQVLEGLHHAHKKGIFHRDIKPSNLILTPDGTVKLMDFGIAKIAGEQRLTQVNRVVGTIEYMPPELIEGKEPSIASDIYAAGVTMYELLTGKLPFESTTDYTLMQEIIKKKPVSVDKLNAAVPSGLSNIVMKALEKKPESRYADAKAFQHALSTAFPKFKEIDLGLANKPVVTTAQKVQVVTQPKTKLKPTTLQTKDTDDKIKPYSFIQTIQQKIRIKQNAPVLIGIISLLLAAVVAFTMLTKKETTGGGTTNPITQNEISNPAEKKEEINNAVIPVSTDTAANNIVAIPTRNDLPLVKNEIITGSAEEKKKEEKKKDPLLNNIKKQTANPEPVIKEVKKEAPPVVVVPEKKEEIKKPEEPVRRTPQTIRLNARLDVNLYLRDAINQATAQEGQSLSFTVSNSVSYNGEVIIAKGASASGRIKNISKKKISIVLNSVTGTSGQSLPFEAVELSGRIEEILSSRNYSGTLKKGTTINF
jgi:eukaryotic-like serine/threonine-protein kinase